MLKDWSQRIPLDAQGLAKLGCALYLSRWRSYRRMLAERNKAQRLALPSSLETGFSDLPLIDQWRSGNLVPVTLEEIERVKEWMRRARDELEALNIPPSFALRMCDMLEARHTLISDFRFEWHHLVGRPRLIIHLRDLHNDIGSEVPVAVCNDEFGELEELWRHEVWRVIECGGSVELRPDLEHENFLFARQVKDIASPSRKRRGRPSGSIIEDDFEEACDFAIGLVREHGLNPRQAAQEALRHPNLFKIKDAWAEEGKDSSFRRLYDEVRRRVK